MVEDFGHDVHEDMIVRAVSAGGKIESYSPDNLSIQTAHDMQMHYDDIPDPEKFYDIPQASIEAKETYEPLKVYEIKNITDVGFGMSSSMTEYLSFTVNGPLFGEDKLPVGGYVDNSKQAKDFIDPASLPKEKQGNFAVDNGIFGLGTDGLLHLVSYKEREEGKNNISFQRAFQNGPLLLLDGQNRRNPTGTSKNSRSGIGFTSEGKAFVLYSDKPVTFYEFAKLFEDQGCSNAIYLDGNIAAGYEDATGQHGILDPEAIKLQFYHQNQ